MSNVFGYFKTQVGLFRLIFLLAILQWLLSFGMEHTVYETVRYSAKTPGLLTYLYIGVGVAIPVLVVWTLILPKTRGAPKPRDNPEPMDSGAPPVHWVVFLVIILPTVTGGAAFFLNISWVAKVHSDLNTALVIGLGLVTLQSDFTNKT
ncbi:hypothetical protein [Thioclava indica]|uniref:Uncharacterized protein n=1 Tax=Thioclava indica TaxID=1353528 RepID=A0A074JTI7_9RHOB|nr:hypothetical protein [Thioclava indica]KEO61001.1 hypothetical protein DT23_11475 [Thioclava indica]